MIDVETKIHDKFSIEFKIGFSGQESSKKNDFSLNSWIFVPNSLDVNKYTYDKERFYKDMRSNIRLITPVFKLKDIAGNKAIPLNNVKTSFQNVLTEASDKNLIDLEFQLKLFGAVFKSAVRDSVNSIKAGINGPDASENCSDYIDDVSTILEEYRRLYSLARNTKAGNIMSLFAFTDEFMSHQVEMRTIRIIKAIDRQKDTSLDKARRHIADFIIKEQEYKRRQGYKLAAKDENDSNKELLFRRSLLKKYIESSLYLKIDKTEDGRAIQQVSFSLAAGLAMLVYSLTSLIFQKHLGSYPALIFILLVAAYVLKDRIKDLTRWMFAQKLKDKYFDIRNDISIKKKKIGWVKEGMDFISDEKVSAEIMRLRNRSQLETNNDFFEEKIILYRKKVSIDNEMLKNHYDYDFKGINDISRFNINYLKKRMDNPIVPVDYLDESMEVKTVSAERVYTLIFILQCVAGDSVQYKAFRMTANRDGIISID
ncbi:MAG: hypothetical protein KBT67_01110 [bacterium]|nr:hypothetical protein [Candidatus Limimorpha caballi]